jgi:DNA-binding NtrC family response regulator
MFIIDCALASAVLFVASVRTRVLLVEDNEVFRRPLHRALEAAGFEVFAAPSAEDALAVLDEMAVDLLLTDHRLPGMTGVQLVAQLRTTHPALAIIVMTAYATVESAVEARRCGADDYLVKPFEVPDLLRAVDRVLDQQKLPALGRTSDTPTSTKGE